MSVFLFSTVISFLLFEFLHLAQVTQRGQTITLTIAHFARVVLSRTAAITLLLAALVLFLLVMFVLLGVGDQHPYPGAAIKISSFFSSPSTAELLYGFVLGIVLGTFVNRLVARAPFAPLETRDKLDIIIIGFFLFLGLGGGDIFRVLATKVEKISVGAAGINFEAALESRRPSDAPGLAAKPVTGTPASTYLASNGSQGLRYLSQLDRIIYRDKNYLERFIKLEGHPADEYSKWVVLEDLDNAQRFAERTITAPLKCLSAWLDHTADAGPVNAHLNTFADIFRRVGTASSLEGTAESSNKDNVRIAAQTRRQIAADLLRNAATIGIDIGALSDNQDVLKDCEPVIKDYWLVWLFCKGPGRVDRLNPLDCSRASPSYSEYNPLLDEIVNGLKHFEENHGTERRPYFAIGYASLMAQLGWYEAAGAILDAWLQQKTAQLRKTASAWKTADEWFVLRARSMLAAYIEEWITRETAIATVVRDYHIKNLSETATGLSAWLTKNGFLAKLLTDGWRRRDPFERPSDCLLEDARADLFRNLFTSYVSIELARLQNTLKHPSYDIMYAENTTNDLERLMRLDISCIAVPGTINDALVYKSQILETYARNALLYTQARMSVESNERRDEHLSLGGKAAQVGLDTIAVTAREDRARRANKEFIEQIAPSDPIAVQESLTQDLKDLNRALRKSS
jgi:hypothetical protein